jgi:hypothetical protein
LLRMALTRVVILLQCLSTYASTSPLLRPTCMFKAEQQWSPLSHTTAKLGYCW